MIYYPNNGYPLFSISIVYDSSIHYFYVYLFKWHYNNGLNHYKQWQYSTITMVIYIVLFTFITNDMG